MFNSQVFGMHGTKQLRAVRMLIQETGTYGQQWARPFVSTGNGEAVAAVAEKAASARAITPMLFARETTSLIQPTAVPEHMVEISNGWGNRRLRYMLQLAHQDHIGCEQYLNISGYTDYADLSYGGLIDPRVSFTINSITVTRPTTQRFNNGTELASHQVVATNQLVTNSNYQGALRNANVNQVYSIAPDSIFASMQAQQLSEYSQDLYDVRNVLSSEPRLLNRAYNNAGAYCGEIIGTWRNQALGQQWEASNDVLLETCFDATAPDGPKKNPFIRFLSERRRQQYGYVTGVDKTFLMEDLLALDPNITNVTQVVPSMPGMHSAGMSAEWSDATRVTQAATILAQTLPSYMAQIGFTSLAFNASNMHGPTREPIVIITEAPGSFNTHLDQSANCEALKYRLIHELFPGLTFGGALAFDLEMRIDVMGETWIHLSLNGEPKQLYVAPTFADALSVPQITLSQHTALGMTQDFQNIFSGVWEHGINNMHQTNQGMSGNQGGSQGGSFGNGGQIYI